MRTQIQYRTFTPDLEVRSSGDGRTIHGIAVPYDAPQRINDRLIEEFAPGAFDHQVRAADRIPFAREHMPLGGSLIGRLTTMRNDTAGLYIEARASKTPLGDETLELVRDGALRDLSIGFRERNRGNVMRSDGVTRRVKADLNEVAVVMQGAYGDGATITGTRSLDDDDELGEVLRSTTYVDLGAHTPNWQRVKLPALPLPPV